MAVGLNIPIGTKSVTFNKCHTNEWQPPSAAALLFIFFSSGLILFVWPIKADNQGLNP